MTCPPHVWWLDSPEQGRRDRDRRLWVRGHCRRCPAVRDFPATLPPMSPGDEWRPNDAYWSWRALQEERA